ncbi:MAG TPA: T9SS type A sorting domain-containing protein, partial [Bacteroidia bacterium]|nr:T9SS type A sorting domain-containing protein [Bacteroidia bacterium]
TLKLVIDTAMQFTSIVSDSTAKVSGDTLIWSYDSLSDISKTHCVSLNGTISSLPVGDSVFVSMFITPTAGDSVPSNNSVTYWVKAFPYNCVGLPFDPNEKSVMPEGDIPVTQQLAYTIHFQNTGTAMAHNVVVLDTLSPYVDPTTLKVVSSSSQVVTTIASGNIVKFTFDNINLPDTAKSKTSSIGVVKYTIMPLSSDVAGDLIKNKAGIYFDANPVVKTNTTKNTITGTPLSVENISASFNLICFPNPFTNETSIVFNTNGKHYLEINDITGRKIETIECAGNQYELYRNNLSAGIYFIKAFDQEQKYIVTTKIVIQ